VSAVLSRLGLAALVGLACIGATIVLLALSSSATAGGAAALPPDLVTIGAGPEDLMISWEKKRTLLRFTNEVGNDGIGPLEIAPSAASGDCDGDADPANDRDASQRVYEDSDTSGDFTPGDAVASERRFGCMRFHPAHNHWHTLDFASYELRSEPRGKIVAARQKVGFCVVDTQRPFPGAGGPPTPVYPHGSSSPTGCDSTAVQGLSVGWSDVYALALPGQQLRIDRLRRGRYCLVSEADPRDLLAESDEGNNVTRTRLAIRPRRLTVRPVNGACRI
jgi:hypothetical protein